MKFFSNDAKENSDEPYGRDHSDVVTSDPVAVPQQRAGSPWSTEPTTTEPAATETDAPGPASPEASSTASPEAPSTADTGTEAGSPDDELADRERRDGTDEDQTEDGMEPASRRDETDTLTTYHPDGTVETEDRSDDSVEEAAVKDEGTFDSPRAVEPATGEPLAADSDESGKSGETDESDEPPAEPASRRDADEPPLEPASRRDVDEPPFEPASRRDVEEAPAAVTDDAGDRAEADDTVAAAPVAAAPGSVAAPALDRLFTDGDSFAERFREIQLRFVDSPKEATADAAALVGEAVDKLTGALKAQKDALGGDSEDTEQLRVQLRSYRDLLNRLSAL